MKKEDQMDKNVILWVWLEAMSYTVQKVLFLLEEVFQKFKHVLKFKVYIHRVYLQESRDMYEKSLPCEYKLDEAAIEKIIQEWLDDIKFLVPNEEITEEEADREVLRDTLRRRPKENARMRNISLCIAM